MRISKSLFSMLLIGQLTSCGIDKGQTSEQCESLVSSFVIQIREYRSAKQQHLRDFDAFRQDFRSTIGRCTALPTEIETAGGHVVSDIEVLIMAGLDDRVNVEEIRVAEMDQTQRTQLLFTAVRFGSARMLESLLENGLQADLRDSIGNIAAGEVVDSPVVADKKLEILNDAGLNLLASSNDGFTMLDAAVLAGDLPVVKETLRLYVVDSPEEIDAIENSLLIAERVESPTEEYIRAWLAQIRD